MQTASPYCQLLDRFTTNKDILFHMTSQLSQLGLSMNNTLMVTAFHSNKTYSSYPTVPQDITIPQLVK